MASRPGRREVRAVARMIDANLNRARESLRVMEDVARFLLDKADLVREIKATRHELAAVVDALEAAGVDAVASRDTPGDVGTAVEATDEYERATPAELATAAGKRLTEALRVIEEACKLEGVAGPARGVEAMRYRAYELERRLAVAMRAGVGRAYRCCLLLTESACRRPWLEVLRAALEAGVDCVQVREKAMSGRALVERVEAVIDQARPRGAAVIVNDRADVAISAGADGVHVGDHDVPCDRLRRWVDRGLVVGVSTHAMDDARAALAAGADYAGVGQVFASGTKRRAELAGLAYVEAFFSWGRLPGLAIGGIDAGNVASVVEAGAIGVAVSGAICAADDPGAAAASIVAALRPTDEATER
ncbi:MAG: thiamine phosphate synthase [Planctomycetota bacterium]